MSRARATGRVRAARPAWGLALGVALGLVLAGGFTLGAPRFAAAPASPSAASPPRDALPPHPDRFFVAERFYAGLRAAREGRVPGVPPNPRPAGEGSGERPAKGAGKADPPPLRGGLVPHHLVAGALISDFFLDLARTPPPTIILVGPNHDNRGARLATSLRGWATPFGSVAPDRRVLDPLVRDGVLVADDAALAPEHSLGGLMPYIRYHLPEARVVPIALHGDVSLEEAERLAAALAPALERGAVLVASVDFSHYLTRAEAEARDRDTWRAIAGHDLPALMGMGNDHLDSPATLAVLLTAMRRLGLPGPERTAHTNSGVLMASDFAETTSYMVLKYRGDGAGASAQ